MNNRRLGLKMLLVGCCLVAAVGPAAGSSSPEPLYSTTFGGSGFDMAMATAVDGQGNAYVTGVTESADFPTTAGAPQTAYGGNRDAFVAKFDSSGNLVFSTYLGGAGVDESRGVAVDGSGNIYVAGFTESSDFPGINGSQLSSNAGDAFLVKLNPSGSLTFSTLVGGSGDDNALALALDPTGAAYLTGETDSADFPTTVGSFDITGGGNGDAYVAKFAASGALVYSSFLGGPNFEDGLAIAVDGSGAAFVAGKAEAGFPTTPGAFDQVQNGDADMFVTKVNPDGASLAYSTYLGGNSWDEGLGIAVDKDGSAYVSGNVQSSNFPTTAGSYQPQIGGAVNAVITKLSPDGSALVYSTFLGGDSWTEADGLAVDGSGHAYIAGHLGSSSLPTTSRAYDTTFNGGVDEFLSELDPAGANLLYSSYVGGADWDGAMSFALDAAGNAYLGGASVSSDFPVTVGPYGPPGGDSFDGALTRLPTTASAQPPANAGLPVVSGTAQAGQTLSTSDGSWSGSAPISFAYQWRRCDSGGGSCVNVGSNQNSYLLTSGDVGATIRAVVTASNSAGSSAATSTQTAVVSSPQSSGTLTFSVSAGGDDGDVAARAPTSGGYPPSGTPAAYDLGTVFTAGRRLAFGEFQVLNGLLRFDTSALPDGATITAATLKLYVTGKTDADNRSLVSEWYPASNWPIDAADYTATAGTSALAGTDITTISTGAVNSFDLTGLTAVSTTGYTSLRLNISGGQPTGDNYLQFAALENANAPAAQLVVSWTLP
jgi:hypothetical protein